jgi:hypothetical protein
MKKIIVTIVVLLCTKGVFSAPPVGPPPPTPPPPPGLPIDGNILILFVLAIVSGYYLSKKFIDTKKGS